MIDLNNSPKNIIAEKIKEYNPNLPSSINGDSLIFEQVSDKTVSDWTAATVLSETVDINDVPVSYIAPAQSWYSPSGGFVIRKVLTFTEAEELTLQFSAIGRVRIYNNGTLNRTLPRNSEIVVTNKIFTVSGANDIAIVIDDIVDYGRIALTLTSASHSETADSTWSVADIGRNISYDWYEPENTKFLEWGGSKLYPSHPWDTDEINGDFIYNGSSYQYSVFASYVKVTPTTDTVKIRIITDNAGYFSVNRSPFASLTGETPDENNHYVVNVTPGEENLIMFKIRNAGGPTGLQADIFDANDVLLASSSTDWPYEPVGTYEPSTGLEEYFTETKFYISSDYDVANYVRSFSLETVASIDLAAAPSEVDGDVIDFHYTRIPVHEIFSELDMQLDVTATEMWPTAAISGYNDDDSRDTGDIPEGKLITRPGTESSTFLACIFKKTLTFTDTTFIIDIQTDDRSEIYVDGELVGISGPWREVSTITKSISPGEHTVAILSANYYGPFFSVFRIWDDELLLDVSDETWPCYTITNGDSVEDLLAEDLPKNIQLPFKNSETATFDAAVSGDVSDIKSLFMSRYGFYLDGFNIVKNVAGSYTITIDNPLYVGKLTMLDDSIFS